MNQQDQALLVAILETAVDAIIVIDGAGEIQLTNPAATRLFGFSQHEMVGNNVRILMPSPYHEEHDGYLDQFHRTGVAKVIGIGREVVGRRKDGSTFPIHLAVSQLSDGDQPMFAGIVRDITDLKQAQQKIAEANAQLERRVQERTDELRAAQAELVKSERLAMLGQVAGGIAHEIRNPLNAVRTSVYYLRHAKNASQEKIVEHLERIDRQVSLIDNVVTALSDIARLPEPEVCRCVMQEVVRDVIPSVSLPLGVRIRLEFPEHPVTASVDPNQIAIVFRNLLRNAREAMPDGGTISITGSENDGESSVSVRDTGHGIPSDVIDRITEPLYSTKARGMGLGLAICVAILRKNRGRLHVESDPGQGSTFTLHFRNNEGSGSQ